MLAKVEFLPKFLVAFLTSPEIRKRFVGVPSVLREIRFLLEPFTAKVARERGLFRGVKLFGVFGRVSFVGEDLVVRLAEEKLSLIVRFVVRLEFVVV